MSKKFSFLITVADDGKLGGKVYTKEDTQKCIDEFSKARDAGREVYMYNSPVPSKSSKSQITRDANSKMIG